MVKYSEAGLDATFGALADATRRGILARLAQGSASVSELAEPYQVSLPAVMKHLGVLERARLVATEKGGRVRRCRLTPLPLQSADEWIRFYQRFWEKQFDSLAKYIEQMKKEDPSWRPRAQAQRSPSSSGGRLPRRGRKCLRPGRTRES